MRECWLPVLSPFPTFFGKASVCSIVKSCDCVELDYKWLFIHITVNYDLMKSLSDVRHMKLLWVGQKTLVEMEKIIVIN